MLFFLSCVVNECLRISLGDIILLFITELVLAPVITKILLKPAKGRETEANKVLALRIFP